MNGELFCVVADAGGAHEAECVYSIWETRELAESEVDRLKREDVECGCYGGRWSVIPATLNAPSDTWIG